jgi:hypothetical protein
MKYKAILCAHGGQTQKEILCNDTYAPVVSWSTIRLLLMLDHMYGWKSKQINFVLAFPQADIKTDVFMEVPQHFKVKSHNGLQCNEGTKNPRYQYQPHVLTLLKNVYGLKDGPLMWYQHLPKGLFK